MFNDERINTESGKIYRRGILYATLVTLLYGALRATYLAMMEQLFIRYLFTELSIVICGLILLSVGAVRFPKNGDERSAAEKHSYFLRAGKIFIVAALAGYAATLPFSYKKPIEDFPINHIILILEVLGLIYFYHSFKTRGIYLNYTVIAEEKRAYYRAVFANVGKLAAALFVAFSFAALLDLGVNSSFRSFLNILWSYLLSVMGLGAEYLFISWTEKRAYDEQDTERLTSGTVIAYLTMIGVSVFTAAVNVVYAFIISGNLSAFPGNVGETLARLSYTRLSSELLTSALTAMVLCLLMAQIGTPKRTHRAVSLLLGLSVFSILYRLTSSLLWTIITPHVETVLEPYTINRIMEILSGMTRLLSLAGIGARFFWAQCLVRDIGMSASIRIPPAIEFAAFLANLFFASQSMARTSAVLNAAVTVFALLFTFGVLNHHKFSPIFTDGERE